MKDILSRKKRKIHNADVQTVHVPMYRNLSLEKIFEFVAGKPKIESYLPDHPDIQKVPKQWIVNVCAAVIGEPFRQWVREQKEERNAHMAEKKEVMIAMDPDMAAKFQASTHVSRKCPSLS